AGDRTAARSTNQLRAVTVPAADRGVGGNARGSSVMRPCSTDPRAVGSRWREASRYTEGSPAPSGRGPAMKTGRNDPCPCGSGKKYKKCCLSKDAEEAARHPLPPTPPRHP